MTIYRTVLVCVAVVSASAAAMAQQGSGKTGSDPAQSPPGRRVIRSAPRNPQQQLKQRQVDGLLNALSGIYDLQTDQRAAVRAEIVKATEEMAPAERELREVQDRMGRYWKEWIDKTKNNDQSGRKPWEDPEFIRLRERMQELRESRPMVLHKTVERVEKVLPAEQVKRARERNVGWFESFKDSANYLQARTPWNVQPGDPLLDSWEAYTKAVIAKFKFDATQVNSARTVLQDVQERALAMRRAQQELESKSPKSPAPTAKSPAVSPGPSSLDQQLEVLFEELKSRLDKLVTEEQRRNAAASERQAPASVKPADEGKG